MKITIAEAGSAANIGSMALIENAIKIAKRIDNNCSINLLTNDYERVNKSIKALENSNSINTTNDLFIFPEGTTIHKICWTISTIIWILIVRFLLFFTTKPYNLLWGRRAKLLKEISQSDYILCIGAERINDVYYKTAYLSLEALDIYEKMGMKLIHFSLTIGPVFYKSTIKKAKKVLDRSFAIFVRDNKSFNLLSQLNITKPHIFNSYDIAILQEKLEEKNNLFTRIGINNDEYVCVSVIDWLFRKAKGPVRQDGYNKAIAETLDYIIEKYNTSIVFTPTVVGIYKVDDVTAGKHIIELMRNKNRVIEIEELLTPKELAYVFSKSKFSIVTRMHAAILCSAAGRKPIIAINYLYKLREYMKNIGFEDYSIDIDYTNAESLISFVDKMFANYSQNLIKLNNQIDKMQTILQENINGIINEEKK